MGKPAMCYNEPHAEDEWAGPDHSVFLGKFAEKSCRGRGRGRGRDDPLTSQRQRQQAPDRVFALPAARGGVIKSERGLYLDGRGTRDGPWHLAAGVRKLCPGLRRCLHGISTVV